MMFVNAQFLYGDNGEATTLPILNLPDGAAHVRIRTAKRDFARAFVKTGFGIREYFMQKTPDGILLTFSGRSGKSFSLPAPAVPECDTPRSFDLK